MPRFAELGQYAYMTASVVCVFAALAVVLKQRRFALRTWWLGFWVAGAFVLLEAAFLGALLLGKPKIAAPAADPVSMLQQELLLDFWILRLPLLYPGALLLCVGGAGLAMKQHHPALPLLRRMLGPRAYREVRQGPDRRELTFRWGALVVTCAAAMAVLTVGILFFAVTLGLEVRPSEELAHLLESMRGRAGSFPIALFLYVLRAALWEEVLVRGFLLVGLERLLQSWRNGGWGALCLSSAIWAMGHAGMMTPEWIKLVQVFVLGLLLGGLYRRLGLEASFSAHALHNVAMIFIAPILEGR